jgi:8-oxo-dGTP diphosphatase
LVKESENLSGKWALPGGGLDFGEDPRTGLEREVEEEMGLDVGSVSEQPVGGELLIIA